ncbi:Bbp1p SCDLUD_001189 [Saccharomycodes ludwigii]|uniref:Bbp1p n=1 Tax=Saccharomycodes ludwigii TaxID=36035 RepID=UPI001E89E054|nr:hypothetical protein SCDLUD_001189 [Saccharomycodes ludwigii]KAH3903547.1 hypothetical protein SCDLUD_001189 [Saccharomycodes ludwigii]
MDKPELLEDADNDSTNTGIIKWTIDAIFGNRSNNNNPIENDTNETYSDHNILSDSLDLGTPRIEKKVKSTNQVPTNPFNLYPYDDNDTFKYKKELKGKLKENYAKTYKQENDNVNKNAIAVPGGFSKINTDNEIGSQLVDNIISTIDSNNNRLKDLSNKIHLSSSIEEEEKYKIKYLQIRQELIKELRSSKELYDKYYQLYQLYSDLLKDNEECYKIIETLNNRVIELERGRRNNDL